MGVRGGTMRGECVMGEETKTSLKSVSQASFGKSCILNPVGNLLLYETIELYKITGIKDIRKH